MLLLHVGADSSAIGCSRNPRAPLSAGIADKSAPTEDSVPMQARQIHPMLARPRAAHSLPRYPMSASPITRDSNILDPGFELTLRPMKYPQFYEMYRSAIRNTWTVE